MNTLTRTARLVALLAFASSVQTLSAQNPANWIVPTGEWDTNENWDTGFFPETQYDEVAYINNGGVATVSSVIAPESGPGQIVLGNLAGETGSLTITGSGALTVSDFPDNLSTAGINVGASGTGHLVVQPNGFFGADTLTVAGEAGSSVTLSGSATVDIQFEATFGRNLHITGPNVDFSAQTVIFQAQSNYVADITGPSHSTLRSDNLATIGGRLEAKFAAGITPTAGDSWDLIDAPGLNGQFAEIDVSSAPELPFGQVFTFSAVRDSSSVNGVFGRLAVEQKLVLNIDRTSGAVSIVNGPAPVDIDGYSISSALGGLTPGGWDSLQNQNVSNWRESPQGGSANRVTELKPTDSMTVASNATVELGDLYQRPAATEFGVELEDLAFEYFSQDGAVTQGIINYTGEKQYNNLVIVVDPSTGVASLQNQSNLAVSIDGYRISSDSGSLQPDSWLSLDDQNVAGGDWRESNPNESSLAELKPDAETLLSGGASFSLGALFDTSGASDLSFQYLFPGETAFRDGVVVYRSIGESLVGDYNGNGIVDAADYTVWRDSLGDTVAAGSGADGDGNGVINAADFAIWKSNFGNTQSAVSAQAVPEPSTVMLMALAFGTLLASRRATAE